VIPREKYLATKQPFRASVGLLVTTRTVGGCCWRRRIRRTGDLPGDAVERGETPTDAVAREVVEEFGVALRVGDLLCVDHTKERQSYPGGPLFRFVFAGPVLVPDDQRFALPPDEIAYAYFVRPGRESVSAS
jgi:ADP-ribose pyrophosphatase YjhB (NUDIX family)